MARKRLLSLETLKINTANLEVLKKDIKEVADSSSKTIYVYRFPKSKIKTYYSSHDADSKLIVRSASATHRRVITKTADARIVNKDTIKTSSEKYDEHWNRIIEPIKILSTGWAVRFEGNKNPYNQEFKTKNEAIDFARNIKEKKKGNLISVVDDLGNVIVLQR